MICTPKNEGPPPSLDVFDIFPQPSFPGGSFSTFERSRVSSLLFPLRLTPGPIVGGEYYQSIVKGTNFLQCVHKITHSCIHLSNRVTKCSSKGRISEGGAGVLREVDMVETVEQEERSVCMKTVQDELVRIVRQLLCEMSEVCRLLYDLHISVERTGTGSVSVRGGSITNLSRITTKDQRTHIMTVGNAKISIKALLCWKIFSIQPNTKVPFTNHPCSVALCLQDLSQGHLI